MQPGRKSQREFTFDSLSAPQLPTQSEQAAEPECEGMTTGINRHREEKEAPGVKDMEPCADSSSLLSGMRNSITGASARKKDSAQCSLTAY